MTIGTVVRNQTPMLMTFEEDEVEYICESLGQSILMAHEVINMFSNYEDWEEDYE